VTDFEIALSLSVTGVTGLVLAQLACRTLLFHRRPRAQTLVGFVYLLSAVGTALALMPLDLFAPRPSWQLVATLNCQAAIVSALLPFLRQFFAHAIIDLRPGERVRIGDLQGEIVYFGWTGLELRLEGEERVVTRLPTWLMDKIISRLPPTIEEESDSKPPVD
jgi:hypothetical protein